MSLLRLVDNPADEVAWFRVLQLVEGLGPVSARRVIEALGRRRRLPERARRGRPGGRGARGAPTRSRRRCFTRATEQSAGVQAEGLRDALAPLVKLRYPDGAIRLTDLDQLVAAAQQATDARHFVAELVLDPPQSSADLAQPAASRRGLPGALHHPLGQGPGVGLGARARRL